MTKLVSVTFAIAGIWLALVVSASGSHVHRLNKNTRVTHRGIGGVRAGMSLRVAERAAGDKLVATQEVYGGCTFVKPQHGPDGISFMVIDGKIARVNVENTFTATEEGARVGDSEARIKRLYGRRVHVAPHAYIEGHYLKVISIDRKYAILFETDGKKVTQYRAGRQPAVGYVEGCS